MTGSIYLLHFLNSIFLCLHLSHIRYDFEEKVLEKTIRTELLMKDYRDKLEIGLETMAGKYIVSGHKYFIKIPNSH